MNSLVHKVVMGMMIGALHNHLHAQAEPSSDTDNKKLLEVVSQQVPQDAALSRQSSGPLDNATERAEIATWAFYVAYRQGLLSEQSLSCEDVRKS